MATVWETAFEARDDLKPFGRNALLLFALALAWQIEDIAAIGATALVDGPDDKKCDLVYIDRDNRRAIVAQSYYASQSRESAPANKASDLNTAIGWLLTASPESVPERIRPFATDLRDALRNSDIDSLHIWYVHNCYESDNVYRELSVVQNTALAALRSYLSTETVEVRVLEVGKRQLDSWYRALDTPIIINDTINVRVPGGYEIHGDDWSAFVTAVPARWVQELFRKYKDDLFSANVRGYLGSRKSRFNINYRIKETVAAEPGRFWVYNNRMTVLVHDFSRDRDLLEIRGISIVNGAQTTGAIGSVETDVNEKAMVATRFVKVRSRDAIDKIREYNNTQNEVEPSDFRSNDHIQTRLRLEFERIPNVRYLGRRGGHEDVIRRPGNLIPAESAAQALAAVHQDPGIAYNEKSNIWRDNRLYDKYFNSETTAEHVVFAYSLLLAVNELKVGLMDRQRRETLTAAHEEQMGILRQRGANLLFVAAVANCIEIFLRRPVPNVFRISFGPVSPDEARRIWLPVVEVTANFITVLEPALKTGLKNSEEIKKSLNEFRRFINATSSANEQVFGDFRSRVVIR